MISQHRIVEERQLMHMLVDLLQSEVCIVNPNTIVTSNKVFQGNTQPPVCEYFSAQPDLNMFNTTSSQVKGASVVLDSPRDLVHPVVGATFECKRANHVQNQTVANMVKLASDLTLNILETGCLVESVHILGVAINFYHNSSKLFELKVDFCNNTHNLVKYDHTFTIGESVNYVCQLFM